MPVFYNHISIRCWISKTLYFHLPYHPEVIYSMYTCAKIIFIFLRIKILRLQFFKLHTLIPFPEYCFRLTDYHATIRLDHYSMFPTQYRLSLLNCENPSYSNEAMMSYNPSYLCTNIRNVRSIKSSIMIERWEQERGIKLSIMMNDVIKIRRIITNNSRRKG